MQSFTRKNFSSVLLILLLGILLLFPGAKAFLLKTFIHTGLLNAPVKKEIIVKAGSFNNLSFINENGVRLNTAGLQGKVIFINFWAVWCPPCIAEMGSVNALYNTLKGDPRFVFILADTDNDFLKSVPFMKKNGYDLPVYRPASTVPENLFSGTIPATLIIDAKGNIVQRHEGIARYDTREMVEFLRSLL